MTDKQFHDLGLTQDELNSPILIVDEATDVTTDSANDPSIGLSTEPIPQISVQKRRPRDYARAYITQSFSLQCNRSQILFERIYSRCDAHFTYLTVSIADRGMGKLASNLEEEIDRRFNTLEQLIETTICECDLLFDARHVPQSNRCAMSDKTRTYEVPLRTNFSARFLKLFTRFDVLLCYIEALWINGVVRSSGRNQMISKWDRQMRDFSAAMRRLRDNTNNHIRAVYETKDQQASTERSTSAVNPKQGQSEKTNTKADDKAQAEQTSEATSDDNSVDQSEKLTQATATEVKGQTFNNVTAGLTDDDDEVDGDTTIR